jgi:hypothetical protein
MKKSGILNFKVPVASYFTAMRKKTLQFQAGNHKGNSQAQIGGCGAPY